MELYHVYTCNCAQESHLNKFIFFHFIRFQYVTYLRKQVNTVTFLRYINSKHQCFVFRFWMLDGSLLYYYIENATLCSLCLVQVCLKLDLGMHTNTCQNFLLTQAKNVKTGIFWKSFECFPFRHALYSMLFCCCDN